MAVDYVAMMNRDRSAPRHAAQPKKPRRATRSVVAAYAEQKMKKRVRTLRTERGATRYTVSGPRRTTRAGKPKLSKAARREIALRNLKKARKAQRSSRRPTMAQAKRARARRERRIESQKRAMRASVRGTKHKRLTPRRPARSTHAKEVAMKGKRKQTKKQRAASLKNLRKARASVSHRIAKSGHTKKMPKWKKKIVRKAGHTASAKPKKAKKALAKRSSTRLAAPKAPRAPKRASHKKASKRAGGKRSKYRHGRKLTKAERRTIALRNLGKARSARRRAKKAGRRHPVKSYSYRAKSKQVRVPRHLSWEAREASKPRKRGRRGQTAKQRAASLRNLAKARRARKSATKRHPVKGYAYKRKGGLRKVPRHMSYEYAMENPLGGVELFVAGLSAIVWFGLTDLLDRVIATHALTDKNAKDTSGHELYADNPPTTGSYANLFNPTAITAPMNLARWGAGIGMTAAPIVIAKWIENPLGRSVFQTAGFGAGIRIFGKALIDLVAKLTMWTKTGQRFYDGEMRAQVLASSDQNPLSSLPSAGLGATTACECANCQNGVGACQATGTGKPEAEKAATGTAGTGWPSMPREVAGGSAAPTPPAPPPPPSLTSPTPSAASTLRGAPGMAGVPVRNPYKWGREEEAA